VHKVEQGAKTKLHRSIYFVNICCFAIAPAGTIGAHKKMLSYWGGGRWLRPR